MLLDDAPYYRIIPIIPKLREFMHFLMVLSFRSDISNMVPVIIFISRFSFPLVVSFSPIHFFISYFSLFIGCPFLLCL